MRRTCARTTSRERSRLRPPCGSALLLLLLLLLLLSLSLSGGCADHGAAMRPAGGTTAHLEAGGGALLEGGLEVLHVLHQP
jgi:hypothetical protein